MMSGSESDKGHPSMSDKGHPSISSPGRPSIGGGAEADGNVSAGPADAVERQVTGQPSPGEPSMEGGAAGGGNANGSPADAFDQQMIGEIRILIDFLSGSSIHSIAAGAAGRLPTSPQGVVLTYSAALQEYFNIAGSASGAGGRAVQTRLSAADRRFLSEFRDYLAEAAKPATANTVAFCTLMSEIEKSGGGSINYGIYKEISTTFPQYENLARNFRVFIGRFRRLSLALLMLVFVASAYAYCGSLYLDRLTESHLREEKIDAELMKAEMGLPAGAFKPPQDAGDQGSTVRLRQCVVYEISRTGNKGENAIEAHPASGLIPLGTSHGSSDAMDGPIEHQNYNGALLADAAFLLNTDVNYHRLCNLWIVAKGDTRTEQEKLDTILRPFHFVLASSLQSSELSGAVVVAILNGYLLPALMGILGSLVFVLRTYLVQLRDKTLHPRDRHIYRIRVLLGSIAGLAIGFFMHPGISTSAATSAAPFNASVSLTTPALAFLAGYAVEIVFSFLDTIAQTLFVARK